MLTPQEYVIASITASLADPLFIAVAEQEKVRASAKVTEPYEDEIAWASEKYMIAETQEIPDYSYTPMEEKKRSALFKLARAAAEAAAKSSAIYQAYYA